MNGESYNIDVDYVNGSEKSYVLSRYRLGLKNITYNLLCGYSCLNYYSHVIRVTKYTLDEVQCVKVSGSL